ncbi:MAG TPA: hypothetical protein VMW81_08570 [Nitrospinota bacterium]|nr:hypothetical protein [Nitrospinota bacterium]
MKGKTGLIILFIFFLEVIPLRVLCADEIVRIANLDNFAMQKHQTSQRTYSKTLEIALESGVVENTIFGIGWGNKRQIDSFSLSDKVISEPGEIAYGLGYLGEKTRIRKVDYPYESRGWTDIHLFDLNGSREVLLEIKGGIGEPVHQQVGNIGIKRPDGVIEDIPVKRKGALDRGRGPVLVLSDDYFYYRKDIGDIKKLLDKELEWKHGFQILIIRKIVEEAPGEDDRFTIQATSSDYNNYNDTVLIRISFDKGSFSNKNTPTIFFGWKSVDEIDEGGDGEED